VEKTHGFFDIIDRIAWTLREPESPFVFINITSYKLVQIEFDLNSQKKINFEKMVFFDLKRTKIVSKIYKYL
jgi:hypothetical protein